MKRLLTFFVVALVVLAGCGGSDDNSSSGSSGGASTTSSSSGGGGSGGTQLTLSADPSGALKFDKKTLSAPAGEVTITMTNPSSVPHDIAIKGGVDKKGDEVTGGGKSVVTVNLKPGKYTFYCSVPGHEAAGMNGELDVT